MWKFKKAEQLFFPLIVTIGVFSILSILSVKAQEEVKVFKTNGQTFLHKIKNSNNGKSGQDSNFKSMDCEDSMNRTIDGSCNNTTTQERQEWGMAEIQLFREMSNEYGLPDGFNDMGGQNRNSARAISNLLCDQTGDMPSSVNLSAFVFTWGQFLDHDITLTPDSHSEAAPIPLPDDEPLFTSDISFTRSAVHEGTGMANARQQTNLITSWVDASNVYGSDEERANWLRTFEDGKLKTSAGNLLPFNTINGEYNTDIDFNAPSMAGDNGFTKKVFVAGDVRANEQAGLTTMHTLFVREHNRICDRLIDNGMNNDEEIYQRARKMIGGMIQNITYEEFLPALGINLPNYQNYDSNIQVDINNIFATAAYRLGHTMVTEELLLLDDNCNPIDGGTLGLLEAFFNPDIVRNYGIDPIMKGLAVKPQQEIDLNIIDGLRNFLFSPPGSPVPIGLDLASLNIQRGRDHGLPDYNYVRKHYLGTSAQNFSEITNDVDVQNALSQAYNGEINDIDLWVGLLAEDHMPGKSVGATLNAILEKQFVSLRDGDYFYFENDPALSNQSKDGIRNTQLSEIIERNTDINDIQRNVFTAMDCEMIADNGNNGPGGNNGGPSGDGGNNGPGGDGGNNGPGGNNGGPGGGNNGPGGGNNNGPGGDGPGGDGPGGNNNDPGGDGPGGGNNGPGGDGPGVDGPGGDGPGGGNNGPGGDGPGGDGGNNGDGGDNNDSEPIKGGAVGPISGGTSGPMGGDGNGGIRVFGDGAGKTDTGSTSTIESTSKLTIYPNPAEGMLNVQLDADDVENYRIEILDLNGNTVLTREENNTSLKYGLRINVSELPIGFYILNVIWDGNSQSRKLMIMD